MRIFAIAALAACLSGAAAYAEPENQSIHEECERAGRATERVDAAEIQRIVERAMEEARQAIRDSQLDESTQAELEASIEAALEGARVEIAEGRAVQMASLSEAQQQAIEARVEAAMARAEAAVDAREASQAAIEERVQAAMARAEAALARSHQTDDLEGAPAPSDEDKNNILKLDGGAGYQGGARM